MRRRAGDGNVEGDLGVAGRIKLVIGRGELRVGALHAVEVFAVFLIDVELKLEVFEARSVGGLLHVLRKTFGGGHTVGALTPFEVRSAGFCVERDGGRRGAALLRCFTRCE